MRTIEIILEGQRYHQDTDPTLTRQCIAYLLFSFFFALRIKNSLFIKKRGVVHLRIRIQFRHLLISMHCLFSNFLKVYIDSIFWLVCQTAMQYALWISYGQEKICNLCCNFTWHIFHKLYSG